MSLALLTCARLAAQTVAAPPLAESLSGEPCVVTPRKDIAPAAGLPVEAVIECGGKPAGVVAYAQLGAPASGDAEKAQLVATLTGSRVWAALQRRLDCRAPTFADASGAAYVAVPCRALSGGFPDLILAARRNGVLVVAEGSASLYPVLRAAIGLPSLAKTKPEQAAEVQALWGEPVVLAAAADIARLEQLRADARVSGSLARYPEEELLWREALDLQTRLFSENDTAAADIIMNLALNVSNQGRADEAAALFRRAAPIMERSPKDTDRARLATYRGYEAANRGEFDAALQFAKSAVASWRAVASGGGGSAGAAVGASGDRVAMGRPPGGGPGAGGRPPARVGGAAPAVDVPGAAGGGNDAARAELAMALNLEAVMLLRNGDVESAAADAGEALLLLDSVEGEPKWWKADVNATMGEISIAQGRVSAAEIYFRSALASRFQIFGEGTATLRARAGLGRAYATEGMNTAAIIAYRDAFTAARSLPRGAVPFTANDLAPFAGAVVAYAATLESASERQGLFAEAFDAFQLVRSPTIDRTIANTSARLAASDPAIAAQIRLVQDAERALTATRLRLAAEQALPAQERSGLVEGELAETIKTQTADARRLRRDLDAKFPDYATLSDPKPLTLDAVRARLGDDEAALSFLIARDRAFAQVVRRGAVYISEVKGGQVALKDSVTALRRSLEIQGGSINEFDLGRAHQLYTDLFGGLDAAALTGVKHLVVVPAGPLASLPFSLLVASPPAGDDYLRADWLAKRMAITHSPSLAAFLQLRSTRPAKRPDLPLLAFGDPVLGPAKGKAKTQTTAVAEMGATCRTGEPMPGALLRSMASLPDTATELRAVAKALGADPASLNLGAGAQEDKLRGGDLERYRVLYFATHGLLPGELKCQGEPGLVLTPPLTAATARATDGLLEASEVAGLTINADLVVLSACNTAAGGGTFGGEALSGLSEAFFYAGARNLVISHWQVPSAATTGLMTGMFGRVGSMGAAQSLRDAQMAIAGQAATAHPFFWAAFVVMGDGGAASAQQMAGVVQ